MAGWAAPVEVHPLIKFGRWSFLTAGIFYGFSKQGVLSRLEASRREAEEKNKAMRDEQIAKEKKAAHKSKH